MRAILCLFDSLNLRALSCYGGPHPTPNFDRLAARSTQFERHFVGSMPCMPARRDLQTGRLNFLHRSWGPLEPYDVTLTGLMRDAGVHSHLSTDHYHYFETGGATYHTAFTTWDFIRGQEADGWATEVSPDVKAIAAKYHPEQVETTRGGYRYQGMLNREWIEEQDRWPSVRTFDSGLDFIDRNGSADDWFLQIETFDPHEPFFAPPEYKARFGTDHDGPIFDWPLYRQTDGSSPESAELQANYAALVQLCDDQLGRLLDKMDEQNMWDDTALIVTTDHGFLLGEHDWWGKNRMPFYNEIAHIPLFVHVPGRTQANTRCAALSQNIDVMATLLDAFGLARPATVQGRSLIETADTGEGRALALYGVFGGAINATDGRYTYFRYPRDMEATPLYEYTLMPQHSTAPFRPDELAGAELFPGFGFTCGVPVMKLRAAKDAKRPPTQGGGFAETETVLYDMVDDPGQVRSLDDAEILQHMTSATAAAMAEAEAPPELFNRFALERPT